MHWGAFLAAPRRCKPCARDNRTSHRNPSKGTLRGKARAGRGQNMVTTHQAERRAAAYLPSVSVRARCWPRWVLAAVTALVAAARTQLVAQPREGGGAGTLCSTTARS